MEKTNNTTTTFTEEEVTKRVQSETDKVRTEYSKKIKELESKIGELSPVQKSEAEIELEKRLKVLEDKEKEVQLKEKELSISNKLNEKGLPKELSKYLNLGLEDVETSIEDLSKLFNSSNINNSFIPNNHKSNQATITKEDFKKMGYTEKMKLYKENKTLYDLLSK